MIIGNKRGKHNNNRLFLLSPRSHLSPPCSLSWIVADVTGTGRSQVERCGSLWSCLQEPDNAVYGKPLLHGFQSPRVCLEEILLVLMDLSSSDSSQERVWYKEWNDSFQTCDGLEYSGSRPCLVAVLKVPHVWWGHLAGAHKRLRAEYTSYRAAIHSIHSWLLMDNNGPSQHYRGDGASLDAFQWTPRWGTQCISYDVLALGRAWEQLGGARN